jgi:hypothetical protein
MMAACDTRSLSSSWAATEDSLSSNRIAAAYQAINAQGFELRESLDTIRLVDDYREYWRPASTRVVLLAESHVHTSDEDRLSAAHRSTLGLAKFFSTLCFPILTHHKSSFVPVPFGNAQGN